MPRIPPASLHCAPRQRSTCRAMRVSRVGTSPERARADPAPPLLPSSGMNETNMGQAFPKSLHCLAFCETDALSSVTILDCKAEAGTYSNRGNKSSSLSEWAHTGCPESKLPHISLGPQQARNSMREKAEEAQKSGDLPGVRQLLHCGTRPKARPVPPNLHSPTRP